MSIKDDLLEEINYFAIRQKVYSCSRKQCSIFISIFKTRFIKFTSFPIILAFNFLLTNYQPVF